MFKKLKDKLAEEVKSSPQRIQQFAQAAQAAVTSASSSISDITNNDLFSIGDNDNMQQARQSRTQSSPSKQQTIFQDVTLMQTPTDSMDFTHEIADGQRQRRLSNSSFASDVSFRLPNYETPSMYHLQSDMEISASEADERGFTGSPATLERVTKEQLYAAYKRTQERYKKYRTQYGDLARHYKLLERENAKARSVLVETQDKALRRISELKEQCSLEQSAKAHLEKNLRVEIEEKHMKIETLNTKIQFLQSNNQIDDVENPNNVPSKTEGGDHLINLDNENTSKPPNEDSVSEIISLNNKIEKMEQLLNKYKESLKTTKEKNSQITTELQILSKELESKNKQVQGFELTEEQFKSANEKIQLLNNTCEELQNQINAYDFTKTKELSTLEMDLHKANEEIAELRGKIEAFSKKEEEYAISLAENKLSIHKELESKEAEIKSLKDSLSASKKEIVSLKIVVDDYKNNLTVLEDEKNKLNNDCAEFNTTKSKISEMETQIQELTKKSVSLEQLKTKTDEEYKCLQLQFKQETAEKLAMIDRNVYLEGRNTQLTEENMKKTTRISNIESELQAIANNKDLENDLVLKETEKSKMVGELHSWKEKCGKLELEIQEEREELVKLQTEIEKLLTNHELIQTQNAEYRSAIANLTSECSKIQQELYEYKSLINKTTKNAMHELKEIRQVMLTTTNETKSCLQINKEALSTLAKDINILLNDSVKHLYDEVEAATAKYNSLKLDYDQLKAEIATNSSIHLDAELRVETLQKENNGMKSKLKEFESETSIMHAKLLTISNEYEVNLQKMKSLNTENATLTTKVEALEQSSQQIQTKLDREKQQHILTTEKMKILDTEKQNLNQTIKTLEDKNIELGAQIEQLQASHNETVEKLKKNYELLLKTKEEKLQISEQLHETAQHSAMIEKLNVLETEKSNLHDMLKNLENDNVQLSEELALLNEERNISKANINQLNIEIQNKTNALEKIQNIQASLEQEIAQYVMAGEISSELEKDKQQLIDKIKLMEEENKLLNAELHAVKGQNNELNNVIMTKSNEFEAKLHQVTELEENVRFLSQENILLKTEASNFVSNIKNLETEIDDIKKSHMEIEIEKEHLNEIIDNLGSKQTEDSVAKDHKDTQTDNSPNNVPQEEAPIVFENKWALENKLSAMSHTASLNLKKKEDQEDLYEQYSLIKISNDSLKDENRRLKSDIEGLQTYLAKISKENSVLNDKLRELIATSEHSTDSDQQLSDDKEQINEIQVSKDKVNDLLRENSLLIEENLELKDQLQSQNYAQPNETKPAKHNDKDFDMIKVNYNDLLQTNSQLETRIRDLEQYNKSFNGNVQQLQDKNERLKLSNEKLERRLDEALVSLRHLHSLQENTELEYLRNILYEYLTGSGSHSITLAKVIAAIVKFDDVQTQMVLQKEKERQGFLRQLGII